MSNTAPITQTGVQGFLLWYKREQPELFKKIAPQLPTLAPKAFSNYNAKYKRAMGRLGTTNHKKVTKILRKKSFGPALGELGDYYASYFSDTDPVYASDALSIDTTSAPIDVGTIDTGSIPDVTPDLSPVASFANSGVSSTPTVAAIGQVIGAASQVYLTSQQSALQQSALQTNLQRAAAGLPPLNTSLNALGVPTISTGSLGDSGTLILLLLAAGAALALTSGKKL